MMDNNTKMLLIIGVGLVLFLMYNNGMMSGGNEDEMTTSSVETLMDNVNGVDDTSMSPDNVVELSQPVVDAKNIAPPATSADKVNGSNSEVMYAEFNHQDTMVKPENTINMMKKNGKVDPKDLLPSYSNLESGLLDDINIEDLHDNYLTATPETLIGVNTVGSSNKNPNYGIRSEPANPRTNVSPWNVSTITPDLDRKPLEIGCEN
jgi:hypothetical protein